MNILGIESSCDETSAAIVNDRKEILANIVLSQLEEHRAFGGVVPEIAARAHADHMDTIIRAALSDAGITMSDIDAVASTSGPGLIGGLIVGMMAGKALAASRGLPFIAVNHLEGHALTPRLTDNIEFPYLLLLVSGGHTQILVAEGVGKYKRWGTTLDDAAGECFDKCGKMMGLPYPAGPEIQRIARECKDPKAALKRFGLPKPMKGRKELDFSFSGLKTAVRLSVEALPEGDLKREDVADLSCALQLTIADVIKDRARRALERYLDEYKPANPTLVLSGGVSANTAIRESLEELCSSHGVRAYAPPLKLCGDNAAMIAWAGLERFKLGLTDPLDSKPMPRWPLDPKAEKRHGAGVKA
ncbi:MAG: tRNA (adenosine(37)-N6)-threonylcarbamoyltransferase complex transferase subunit TsaD [Micavibrio sp.]|nr:tRNA (adenosine(37)-N6)-threonylcarbamoyltransferase complex transferase subunit TsaD [Micavibrio sp.]